MGLVFKKKYLGSWAYARDANKLTVGKKSKHLRMFFHFNQFLIHKISTPDLLQYQE